MPEQFGPALITETTALFAFLAAVLGAVFWLNDVPALRRLFTWAPPVIWAYFLPMLFTTFGITPSDHPLYDWMARYLLPFSLFLLMITVDLPAILRLGRTAILMMLAGTLGVVIGGPVAYLLFRQWLPADAWMGLASLSGSWIGGTANLVAIQQSIGAPDSVIGPIIVVDTVVGYGWMGVLIALSGMQRRFDRWIRADTRVLDKLNASLEELDTSRRPAGTGDLAVIVGIAFAAAALAVALGNLLPPLEAPAMGGIRAGATIISRSTWAILIVVTGGLLLSFTPLRKLEQPGASRVGYVALYLLLTSIGAQADLRAVLDVPVYLLTGLVWIGIHITILILVARLLRAPLFFVATGSMANIGGAASAPIVASVYLPAMAPVGLLMAVAGYILGIYAGIGCAWILATLASM